MELFLSLVRIWYISCRESELKIIILQFTSTHRIHDVIWTTSDVQKTLRIVWIVVNSSEVCICFALSGACSLSQSSIFTQVVPGVIAPTDSFAKPDLESPEITLQNYIKSEL